MTIPEIEEIYARNQGMLEFARAIEVKVTQECLHGFIEESEKMKRDGEGLSYDQGIRIFKSIATKYENVRMP